MGWYDVYPVEMSKVGSLLHYVIAYLGLLNRLPTLDVSTGYASSRPMTCTPDDGCGECPKHVEYSCSYEHIHCHSRP